MSLWEIEPSSVNMSQIKPSNEIGSGPDLEIAKLKELVRSLDSRVRHLEQTIQTDHATLEADHRRIESLEHTGVVSVKPVGL